VFLGILAYKAESAGRVVIPVDPRNTSRRCPECGHTAKENRPTQEKFHCAGCGHTAHADVVGALNVLRAGLALRDAAEVA
jgi:putative transposase